MKLVLPLAVALIAVGGGALAQSVGSAPSTQSGMASPGSRTGPGGGAQVFQQREQAEARMLGQVVLNVCSEELKTYCPGKTGDAALRCLDYRRLHLKGACKTLHTQAQLAQQGR